MSQLVVQLVRPGGVAASLKGFTVKATGPYCAEMFSKPLAGDAPVMLATTSLRGKIFT